MEKNYLDLFEVSSMTFEKPDMETFYGLQLAYDALEAGGNVPTVFNAANERAVAMFLDRKISFLEIPEIIQKAMVEVSYISSPSVEDVLATERETNQVIDGFLS